MQYRKAIIHRVERGQPPHPNPISKSKEEWKAELDDQTYMITREGGTEPAGSGSHCSRCSLECIIVHVAIRRCLIREPNLNPAAGGQALTNLLSKTAYATSKMFLTA